MRAHTHIITDRESNSQKQHGIPVLMRGVSGWVPKENLATLPPLDLEGRLPEGDRDGTGPKAHRSILRRVGAQAGWRWRQKAEVGMKEKQLTPSIAGLE